MGVCGGGACAVELEGSLVAALLIISCRKWAGSVGVQPGVTGRAREGRNEGGTAL